MKKKIDSPFCDGTATLIKRKRKIPFRKDEFEVNEFYYKCEHTGEEFSTEETGDVTLNQLYNQYREKHNIPFPIQLTTLRTQYELSAARMSAILGFGPNIFKNYEKGEIPNKSNSTLLNIAIDPKKFFDIANNSKHLSELELAELKKRVDKLNDEKKANTLYNVLIKKYEIPNEYTGYHSQDIDKIAHTVICFLKTEPNLFKTRLNKLLFYADFLNFKNTGFSITGCSYQAITMGPVPYRYDIMYELLAEFNYINVDLEIFKNGNVFEKFSPNTELNKNVFSVTERDTIKFVSSAFKNVNTQDIIKKSHKEKGWIENEISSGKISYQKYGFDLKL